MSLEIRRKIALNVSEYTNNQTLIAGERRLLETLGGFDQRADVISQISRQIAAMKSLNTDLVILEDEMKRLDPSYISIIRAPPGEPVIQPEPSVHVLTPIEKSAAKIEAATAARRAGIAEQERIARDKLLQEVRDAQVRAEAARVRAEIFKQHRFSELPQVAQDNINRIEEKGAVRKIRILRAL